MYVVVSCRVLLWHMLCLLTPGVVTYKSYSDNTCTTMTGSEEQKTNTCNFDLELFMETLATEEDPPSGYFEYVSTLCQQAVA